MTRELTASDLAVYRVEVTTTEGTQSRFITAAYAATEPGWLLLKDHQHRTVAQFKDHIVVMAERTDADAAGAPTDEDIIREAMAEAMDNPGRIVTR
jgi:hypothetical protein